MLGLDRLIWDFFWIDEDTDIREQENSNIKYECGYHIFMITVYNRGLQWRQDILHFNKLSSKQQCTNS